MHREKITFELAQIQCSPGGWAPEIKPTQEELDDAEVRWTERSYRPEVLNKDGGVGVDNQCGGCRFFAAAGSDYGICWNIKSPLDGCVVFEHGGCSEHSIFSEKTAE